MGDITNLYKILVGKAEGKRPLRRSTHRTILEWILGKRCGLVASGSEWGPVVGSCEHDNEPMGSVKGWEVLD
jgi:hypothetical protein